MDGASAAFERFSKDTADSSPAASPSNDMSKDGESEGTHSVHHMNAGGKHHVTIHGKGGVKHSEHEAGEGGDTCPLCHGTGKD